jgi:hypothetical protein
VEGARHQARVGKLGARCFALGLIEEPLGPSPVPVDEIMRVSGASSGAVQIALLEMDLAG